MHTLQSAPPLQASELVQRQIPGRASPSGRRNAGPSAAQDWLACTKGEPGMDRQAWKPGLERSARCGLCALIRPQAARLLCHHRDLPCSTLPSSIWERALHASEGGYSSLPAL